MNTNTPQEMDKPRLPIGDKTSLAIKFLAVLALIYTLYLSKTLMVPIVVAGFIALFCSRLLHPLLILRIPRALAAALIITGIIALVSYGTGLLAEPASRWLKVLPTVGKEVALYMEGVTEPLSELQESISNAPEDGDEIESVEDEAAKAAEKKEAAQKAMDSTMMSLMSVVAEFTALFFAQLLAIVVMTYFFLVFGDELIRNMVRAQNSFSEKKTTVIIFQAIQDDISRYVMVISIINTCLGIATASAMYLMGVEDPLLWGALATLLNFAPYVGPFVMSIILTGVGFVEFNNITQIAMVPGAFLLLNFLECQFITPTALGQRFNMNPLLVVVWMFIWGWLWGAIGMLIAIPLLVCFKIMAIHLDLIGGWIKVLNGSHPLPGNVKTTNTVQ